MPKGGHNRKPTQLKIVQGTMRKDRSNPNAPELELVIPEPSEGLPKEAKEAYKILAVILNDMRVLTKADQGELESLALARAQIKYLSSKLFNKLDINEFRKVQIALNDAIRTSAALSVRFGLSPADRGRVSVIQEKKSNKWDEIRK